MPTTFTMHRERKQLLLTTAWRLPQTTTGPTPQTTKGRSPLLDCIDQTIKWYQSTKSAWNYCQMAQRASFVHQVLLIHIKSNLMTHHNQHLAYIVYIHYVLPHKLPPVRWALIQVQLTYKFLVLYSMMSIFKRIMKSTLIFHRCAPYLLNKHSKLFTLLKSRTTLDSIIVPILRCENQCLWSYHGNNCLVTCL